jgi:hypothetical protein
LIILSCVISYQSLATNNHYRICQCPIYW